MYKRYNHFLLKYAKGHRNKSTKAEVRLWCELLSKKKIRGYTFNRLKPIGAFIYDFYCKELQLVIEIDGYTHEALEETAINDNLKEIFATKIGLKMMRFTNLEVREELQWVKENIEAYINDYEFENRNSIHY
jgi:very-short-patch-repair endonuclease